MSTIKSDPCKRKKFPSRNRDLTPEQHLEMGVIKAWEYMVGNPRASYHDTIEFLEGCLVRSGMRIAADKRVLVGTSTISPEVAEARLAIIEEIRTGTLYEKAKLDEALVKRANKAKPHQAIRRPATIAGGARRVLKKNPNKHRTVREIVKGLNKMGYNTSPPSVRSALAGKPEIFYRSGHVVMEGTRYGVYGLREWKT